MTADPFAHYRHDPNAYRYMLTQDPRRHPWLTYGWTPAGIAQAQRQELARIQPQRMRGVGDLVARATSAVGVKPCAPCKQRQAKLNRWFPFS